MFLLWLLKIGYIEIVLVGFVVGCVFLEVIERVFVMIDIYNV